MRTGQNIYKRRDGRWEARVFLGKKANGRPNFKYLYASTYREVLLQKNNYEKTISLKNTQLLSNALFSDAAYSWLLNSARHWKPATYMKIVWINIFSPSGKSSMYVRFSRVLMTG